MRKPSPHASIVSDLRKNLDRLLAETEKPNLSANARKSLENSIRVILRDLAVFLNELDPVRQPSSVFDPGDPKIVGRFISLALVAQPRHSLTEKSSFYGSGVYAIYYNGGFPLYAPLRGAETPIYVGQASPAIGNARTPLEQGLRLCVRLNEHRKNIALASSTLDINDFEFRSLVVQSSWETAAEEFLIHLFKPIWNNETKLLFGLGKHGDAAETRGNKRSPWDTIHPGRKWAANKILEDSKTLDSFPEVVAAHFVKHPVFPDMDSLLASFIDELRQV